MRLTWFLSGIPALVSVLLGILVLLCVVWFIIKFLPYIILIIAAIIIVLLVLHFLLREMS